MYPPWPPITILLVTRTTSNLSTAILWPEFDKLSSTKWPNSHFLMKEKWQSIGFLVQTDKSCSLEQLIFKGRVKKTFRISVIVQRGGGRLATGQKTFFQKKFGLRGGGVKDPCPKKFVWKKACSFSKNGNWFTISTVEITMVSLIEPLISHTRLQLGSCVWKRWKVYILSNFWCPNL